MFPTTLAQFLGLFRALDEQAYGLNARWESVEAVSRAFEEVAFAMLPTARICDVAPTRCGDFSDAYKAAYSVRPRGYYVFPTCADYEARMAHLYEDAELAFAEYEAWEAERRAEEEAFAAEQAEEAAMEALLFPVAAMAAYLDWDLPDRMAAA